MWGEGGLANFSGPKNDEQPERLDHGFFPGLSKSHRRSARGQQSRLHPLLAPETTFPGSLHQAAHKDVFVWDKSQ